MGRGTGLGLASVYGIIKNHGGIINVYSEKGEGSTFTIYLAASEKEVIKEEELPEEVLKGEETVLLVDDEDVIIDVGEEILRELGYKVLIARGGKEAVEIYSRNKDKIDIVILDVIMPEMGGGETYDRMKKMNPDIKVLLLSGYSIDGQAEEILQRGCNGFIQKPFNVSKLSQTMREILDQK
jgi:CheY-like chemotaxis protein